MPHPISRLVLSVVFTIAAANAYAQAYRYEDSEGKVRFTDNPAHVPEEFRERLTTRDMPAIEPRTGGNPETASGFLDQIFDQIEAEQAANGTPLSRAQSEAIRGWFTTWLWPLLLTGLVSGVVALGLIVHGLATGHYGWAVANFFIGLTAPIYVCLHVGQNRPVVRFAVLTLLLAPLVVGCFAGADMVSTVRALPR